MHGPEIIARTLSQPDNVIDRHGNGWQYHSRSDHHSKTACWAMLFDLLVYCDPLREAVKRNAVGFGINLEMRDFAHNKKKNLDLVVCTPGTSPLRGRRVRDFNGLASKYKVSLEDTERTILDSLPMCHEVPVGDVLIALEAKAAMTAHQRALPRLFDELNSSHNIVHGHTGTTIAAGLVLVNIASTFVSPDRNPYDLRKLPPQVSQHNQPRDAALVIDMVRNLPKRADTSGQGFDALGMVVIDCQNDGTAVSARPESPCPQPGDIHHYEDCIRRLCSLYRSRYPLV